MKQRDILHTVFNELDRDLRAEIVAAEMVEHGIDPDRILILMLGALKRPHSKDVDAVEEELSAYDHQEYTILKTPREGLYDMLPQALFHQPAAHMSARTEKELIRTIQQRRKEEGNARKFFLPFEASVNYLRMQMALYENRLDKRSHYDDLVNIFSQHWEIFQYLDARQAGIFLHLIPIIHAIRDNHPVIETVMEMIFLLPVAVSMCSQAPLHPPDPIISVLGAGRLGIDLTTGNALYEEGVDEIAVRVGPMPQQAFATFRQGGTNLRIFDLLTDYLLPAHLDIVPEFVLDFTERTTRLAGDAGSYNAVLGSDTYL